MNFAQHKFGALFLAFAILVAGSASRAAVALDTESSSLFNRAASALKADAPGEAIAALEQIADRGVLHPDVSYDRAIAYIKRAHSQRVQAGDLGRAVAALEETLTLRPTDAEAEATLAAVHQELSRERSRKGAQSLLARPPLGRALVRLLPENFWVVAALGASVCCTIGLFAAWLAGSQRRRFVGKVVASIAGAACLLSSGMLSAAMQMRHDLRAGVVIVPEARLRDAAGLPLPVTVTRDTVGIPEGARVDVAHIGERLCEVLWGETKAYVESSDLQLLPKP
jgi:hypothetical protein